MKNKYCILLFLFTLWLLLTFLLTLSIVGLFIFIPDRGPSTWMRIGIGLMDVIVNLNTKEF